MHDFAGHYIGSSQEYAPFDGLIQQPDLVVGEIPLDVFHIIADKFNCRMRLSRGGVSVYNDSYIAIRRKIRQHLSTSLSGNN